MIPTGVKSSWLPIKLLKQRFTANVNALATRYPALADALRTLSPSPTYYINTDNDRVVLGVGELNAVRALPVILSPASAKATADSMFPDGNYKLALVAGEDLGWLWNILYHMKVSVPSAPGHRPPLFFMLKDLDRLWIMLHIQDWAKLLADNRVRLFVGPDCVDQFRQSLMDEPMCPWPRLSVTISPDIWPAGVSFDQIFVESCALQSDRLATLSRQLEMLPVRTSARAVADKFISRQPLKVLGITSRYTSFIQHSMRDWLDAFNRLGHTTRLAIELADHLTSNNLAMAQTCIDFEPDLIVCIDHYRGRISGVPSHVPMVMWVQDALPPLFSTEAGKAQGPLDFAMGIAPLRMVHQFGYPRDRYMPAVIGANDARFTPASTASSSTHSTAPSAAPLTPAAALGAVPANRFRCDVSFVSHASTTPQVLLERTIQQHDSPHATRVITSIFNRLKEIYDTGFAVTEPAVIRRLIDAAIVETKTIVPADQIPVLMQIFTAQINNAFFRHQPLQWLADAGIDLHLYGNGWEQHPTLSRFAKGPADNEKQLAEIYRTSRINLHASPFGAVHQRVFEALSCGSLPMFRFCPGDILERHLQQIGTFCEARGITTDAELKQQAGSEIQDCLEQLAQSLQCSPFEEPWSLMDAVRFSQTPGNVRGACAIWGEDYDRVAFASKQELIDKATYFIQNPDARQQRIDAMRKPVMERFTYLAITRQLLGFISDNLQRNQMPRSIAA
jgi:hypothetical protein